MEVRTALNYFARYAGAGTPSAEVGAVEEAREAYAPERDYWKQMREAIEENADDTAKVIAAVGNAMKHASPKKASLYGGVGHTFLAWLKDDGVKTLGRLPGQQWRANELVVQVNPELLVDVEDKRYIVKLWFREGALNHTARTVVLHLIAEMYGGGRGIPAILDVRNGKVYAKKKTIKQIDAYLEAKAAGFVSLWKSLGSPQSPAASF